MTDSITISGKSLFADKKRLKELVAEQNAKIGVVYDANATAEQARALILADGVRPEDNVFSCGIISARDEQ